MVALLQSSGMTLQESRKNQHVVLLLCIMPLKDIKMNCDTYFYNQDIL